MKQRVLLLLLFVTAFSQSCNLDNQFAYQGKCLDKSCINDKLYRIKLIPLDPLIDTNVGKLSTGITYSAAAIKTNGATSYRVIILYGDNATDQITSDPINCIDYRIYQNKNSFDVDTSRMNQASEGSVASWPQTSYTYNQALSAAQIQFVVTQDELDSRQCNSFTYSDQTQWECFFELAFVIQGVTQASYYFSFTVTVNVAVRAGNIPAVDFVKIIQVERCAGQTTCAVSVMVPTSLWFCKSAACDEISLTPYFLLYINRDYYMLHRIDDAGFAASWFIQDVVLTFQSFNFNLKLTEQEFNVISRVAGHNIYQLHVPIVASDVLITAFGNIRQFGSTIINESISATSIRTGQVLSAADEAAAIKALADARFAAAALKAAQIQAAIQAKIDAQAAADAIVQAAYMAKVKADAEAHAKVIAAAKAAAAAAAAAAAEAAAAQAALAAQRAAAEQAALIAGQAALAQQAATKAIQQAAVKAAEQDARLVAQRAAAQAAYAQAVAQAQAQAAAEFAANQRASSLLGATSGDAAAPASCDQINNFLYQTQCVSKSCLSDKLSRIQLIPLDQFTTDVGILSLGITYTATVIQKANLGSIYHVQILYGDEQNNQLVSDPVNCIDWRVYQTKNSYDIDMTRVGVAADGLVPTFPTSSYKYNQQSQAAQIDFNLTQADLDNQKCIKLTAPGQVQWECFFELAFIVKGVTQVSYYFSIMILVDNNVQTASPPAVSFVKIVQIERCPMSAADGNVCLVKVSVDSDLLFCQDATCTNVQKSPYFMLYVNRVFWMIHRLNDAAFNSSWYINNVTLNYQALGFNLALQQNGYKQLAHNAGFNIYELHIPIVVDQVLISAKGVLSQASRRMLLEEKKVFHTHASQLTGPISQGPVFIYERGVDGMYVQRSQGKRLLTTNNNNNNSAYLIGSYLAIILVMIC